MIEPEEEPIIPVVVPQELELVIKGYDLEKIMFIFTIGMNHGLDCELYTYVDNHKVPWFDKETYMDIKEYVLWRLNNTER